MQTRSQCWKIYALGGGLGHLHRSLALGRVAASKGHSVQILTNSRFANHLPWENELGKLGSVKIIDHGNSLDRTKDKALSWLKKGDYDRLIIDTLPRGIGGELNEALNAITKKKVLVHRDLNPDYVNKYKIDEFIQKYNLIIIPGETDPISSVQRMEQSHSTKPWLIRDRNEILGRVEARSILGMDMLDKRSLAIISCTGRSDEEHIFLQIKEELVSSLPEWCFKISSPILGIGDISPWPLMELMNGIDMVIGSGGYNTVNEVRATSTPFRARPLPRMYDRQSKRLKKTETYTNIQKLKEALRATRTRSSCQSFKNGAHEAVNLIEGEKNNTSYSV